MNFISKIICNILNLVSVQTLNNLKDELGLEKENARFYEKVYREQQEELKILKEDNLKKQSRLLRAKGFWNDKEWNTITKIESIFYELGYSATFSDSYEVRVRETKLVNEAQKAFRESLEKGIILYEYLNFRV